MLEFTGFSSKFPSIERSSKNKTPLLSENWGLASKVMLDSALHDERF
jgi:hypothetical protein